MLSSILFIASSAALLSGAAYFIFSYGDILIGLAFLLGIGLMIGVLL